MDVRFVPLELARIDQLRIEAVFLPFFEDERPLRGAAGLLDWRLCGALSELIRAGRITGARGELTLLLGNGRLPFDKVVLIGEGPSAAFNASVATAVTAQLLDAAKGLRLRGFACALPGRSRATVRASDATRWFLDAAGADAVEEVVVLDEPEAQRAMLPIVEAERRRARAVREREGAD